MLKKWFRKKKPEKPTSQGLYVSRECLTSNIQIISNSETRSDSVLRNRSKSTFNILSADYADNNMVANGFVRTKQLPSPPNRSSNFHSRIKKEPYVNKYLSASNLELRNINSNVENVSLFPTNNHNIKNKDLKTNISTNSNNNVGLSNSSSLQPKLFSHRNNNILDAKANRREPVLVKKQQLAPKTKKDINKLNGNYISKYLKSDQPILPPKISSHNITSVQGGVAVKMRAPKHSRPKIQPPVRHSYHSDQKQKNSRMSREMNDLENQRNSRCSREKSDSVSPRYSQEFNEDKRFDLRHQGQIRHNYPIERRNSSHSTKMLMFPDESSSHFVQQVIGNRPQHIKKIHRSSYPNNLNKNFRVNPEDPEMHKRQTMYDHNFQQVSVQQRPSSFHKPCDKQNFVVRKHVGHSDLKDIKHLRKKNIRNKQQQIVNHHNMLVDQHGNEKQNNMFDHHCEMNNHQSKYKLRRSSQMNIHQSHHQSEVVIGGRQRNEDYDIEHLTTHEVIPQSVSVYHKDISHQNIVEDFNMGKVMVVHKNIHHHHFHPNERSMMQMSQNFRSEDAMVKSSHNMITRGLNGDMSSSASIEELPDGWKTEYNKDGAIVYFNLHTGTRHLSHPLSNDNLPPGWEIATSKNTRKTFYVNHKTGLTQFSHPLLPKEKDKIEDNSQLPSLPADTDSSFNTWKKKQIIPPNPYTDVLKENIFFKEYMLSKKNSEVSISWDRMSYRKLEEFYDTVSMLMKRDFEQVVMAYEIIRQLVGQAFRYKIDNHNDDHPPIHVASIQGVIETIESEFTHHYTQCRVFKQTLENAENKMRKDPFIPW